MNNIHELNVLAYADKEYEIFIPSFIYFCLLNNPTAFVEISTPNSQKVIEENKESFRLLTGQFGYRYLIRDCIITDSSKIISNTIRFIDPAQNIAKFIYIGDIDIMITEDILSTHISLIDKYQLPFSNIIRKGSGSDLYPRLSGLHFIEWNKYYPLADISDLDLNVENDEHILYELMRRKGLMIPLDFNHRPELGLHMSLSRDPFGRSSGPKNSKYSQNGIGWQGQSYWNRFSEIIQTEQFRRLLSHADIRFKLLVLCAEALMTNDDKKLSDFALAFVVNRPALLPYKERFLKEAIREFNPLDLIAFPMRHEIIKNKTGN